jgi:hypothetical protein
MYKKGAGDQRFLDCQKFRDCRLAVLYLAADHALKGFAQKLAQFR